MRWIDPRKLLMPSAGDALPGRREPMKIPAHHFVLGTPLAGAPPPGMEEAFFGMGCFWGAEKRFWSLPGVFSTSVGYGAGFTENPTYEEVCSGRTGHNELVRVVFDPSQLSYEALLAAFWEGHDPTQGMRQGPDVGTQYRSGLYPTTPAQSVAAQAGRAQYQAALQQAGYGAITTEIRPVDAFYFAEGYHQQYLAKNPDGYCGHGGTGVACPIGLRR